MSYSQIWLNHLMNDNHFIYITKLKKKKKKKKKKNEKKKKKNQLHHKIGGKKREKKNTSDFRLWIFSTSNCS